MTATAEVLVLLDHTDDGALRPQARELLTLARTLGTAHGVWVTSGSDPSPEVLAEVGRYGAGVVDVVGTGEAHPRLTPVVAEALAALVGAGTRAVLLDVELRQQGGRRAARRADRCGRHGRRLGRRARRGPAGGHQAGVRRDLDESVRGPHPARDPRAQAARGRGGGDEAEAAQVVRHEAAVSAVAAGVEVVERIERATSDRPDLGAAQVVVVGGRGTEGDFGPLEELADVLGGAVGATRVATDEGWIDKDAQIGQTGVTVAPRLYIGAGVSGAVHHRGGMQAAGVVVAINTDPDAPIFEIADLGIVGDLRECCRRPPRSCVAGSADARPERAAPSANPRHVLRVGSSDDLGLTGTADTAAALRLAQNRRSQLSAATPWASWNGRRFAMPCGAGCTAFCTK